ncbi:unnamed protein product, partial [Ectocarpus sp. 4 AP-2014]
YTYDVTVAGRPYFVQRFYLNWVEQCSTLCTIKTASHVGPNGNTARKTVSGTKTDKKKGKHAKLTPERHTRWKNMVEADSSPCLKKYSRILRTRRGVHKIAAQTHTPH